MASGVLLSAAPPPLPPTPPLSAPTPSEVEAVPGGTALLLEGDFGRGGGGGEKVSQKEQLRWEWQRQNGNCQFDTSIVVRRAMKPVVVIAQLPARRCS